MWINCTNLFDGASGFGGYRESGFGREGGREGLFEYVRHTWQARPRPTRLEIDGNGKEKSKVKWGSYVHSHPLPVNGAMRRGNGIPPIDRTAKMFIGGKQVRPDGHYSRAITAPDGTLVGEVGDGNRKDIRDAVEAAHAAKGWADRTPHVRAQIMYYIAENMAIREEEFTRRLAALTGQPARETKHEVETAISRLFTYAAYADKYGGTVQETTLYGLVVALNEPIGVIRIACPDETPLLGFVSLLAPAIARGNTVVIVPSEKHPLIATDFYQILETSDLPGGVVNIVTGNRDHLTRVLAEHEDVDAVWYFGGAEGSAHVEHLSAVNMKRTWVDYGESRNWFDAHQGEGEEFLREATQVKNVLGLPHISGQVACPR